MREILFRGKDANSNEWRIGYFYTAVQGCVAIIGDGVDGYQVKHETVGQYTGLTDKNGKKIFEGDIVNYNGSIHKVVFENRCYNARFGIVVEEKETWSFGMSVPPYLMEVIGNIHDNPELLEVKQ